MTGAEGAVVTFEGTVRNNTKGRADALPGLRMLREHGAQDDGPDRPGNRRRASDGPHSHGASPGPHADRRNQRGGDRHRPPPAAGFRGRARRHQPAEETRSHLEERALRGRRSLGGRRVGPEMYQWPARFRTARLPVGHSAPLYAPARAPCRSGAGRSYRQGQREPGPRDRHRKNQAGRTRGEAAKGGFRNPGQRRAPGDRRVRAADGSAAFRRAAGGYQRLHRQGTEVRRRFRR